MPDVAQLRQFLAVSEHAARTAGAVLRDWASRFTVREKGPADLVTEADLAAQEAVRGVVLGVYPDHGLLGEEGGNVAGAGEYRWIVDPLDGTTNYVHGLGSYGVSLALERAGRLLVGTVYDPVADECFSALRGGGAWLNGRRLAASSVRRLREALVAVSFPARIDRHAPQIGQFVEVLLEAQAIRRLGSSALNLCYVAAGRLDAFWAEETCIWDVAAGVLLVEEAGGMVTAIGGGPFELNEPRPLAAATPELHRELAGVLDRAKRT